jgi:hypothetical protein
MRLPNAAHQSRPWRIREIAPDFILEDVWALPVQGGADDFATLLEVMLSLDPAGSPSTASRLLFGFRDRLGRYFGWDDRAARLPIPDNTETTLRDRLPEDLRNTATDLHFASLPFSPLYRTDVEFAAELSNETVHGVIHLAWVDQGEGRYQAQMAVYVKPRGPFGKGYMALIKPFRYWVVYPALMRQIGRAWSRRGLEDIDRPGGEMASGGVTGDELTGDSLGGTVFHAVACAVPSDARDLVRPDQFEYADAFVVPLPPGARIAAEDWARAMFMPRGPAQQALAGAWNAVMGLEPPPNGNVLGPFQLVSAKAESVMLVGDGGRYRVRLVVLADKGSLTLATFVQSSGRAWRELLRGILVGHRRVAPILLERAVAAETRKHRIIEEPSSR